MRPIDADALIAELQKDEAKWDKEAEDTKDDPSYTECYSLAMWSRANGVRDAIVEVYDAPTIDAVSVVRCKDCRFGTWDEDVEAYDCELHKGMFEPRHYCRDGERKESE